MGLGMMIAERHKNDMAWQRKRRERAMRKKMNNTRNRKARAELYSQFAMMGTSRHQVEAARWHATLTSISLGTL